MYAVLSQLAFRRLQTCRNFYLLVLLLLASPLLVRAQVDDQGGPGDLLKGLQVHGDFQMDAQYYRKDSLIGAPEVPERIRSNTVANFVFSLGQFTAGVRYEAYLPQLQGFDPRFQGSGIPYRFLQYDNGRLRFTVGNFYEQFGSGLILRTFEDRNLGFDNSIDGARFVYKVVPGVTTKALIGRQRTFFNVSQGIIRGGDVEFHLNEMFPHKQWGTQYILGAAAVSKFQKDDDPTLVLPQNVAATSMRATVTNNHWNFYAEYAYKANDPGLVNNYSYNYGDALLVTAAYTKKFFGLSLSAKRTDNMDFRNERTAVGNNLNINYLTALTKQHTYALSGTIYPYAIQPLGEMAAQGELTINLPKGSTLGGKYGTTIAINVSAINNIDKNLAGADSAKRITYSSDFFKVGRQKYFRDYNIEVTKKFSPSVKGSFTLMHLVYNKDVIQGLSGYGIIDCDIAIADVTWRVNGKHTLRFEGQTLQTQKDMGSWAMGLIEYNFTSKFFAAIIDQYNYGNPHEDKRIHYVTTAIGYNWNTTSLRLTYGRQRAGIVCVGGVCRNVPASNGLMMTLTSSF